MNQDSEKKKQSFSRGDSWYNRDWIVQKRVGQKGGNYIYVGTYYDLQPREQRLRMRVTVAVSTVILIVIYLLLAFADTQGALCTYVGYPCAFGIAPLLYYCMGAFWYVYTGGKMTYRRYHASEKRLKTAGWRGVICMGITGVGEIVFLVLNFGTVRLMEELIYLVGVLICIGQYGMVLKQLRQYPLEPVETGIPEE